MPHVNAHRYALYFKAVDRIKVTHFLFNSIAKEEGVRLELRSPRPQTTLTSQQKGSTRWPRAKASCLFRVVTIVIYQESCCLNILERTISHPAISLQYRYWGIFSKNMVKFPFVHIAQPSYSPAIYLIYKFYRFCSCIFNILSLDFYSDQIHLKHGFDLQMNF